MRIGPELPAANVADAGATSGVRLPAVSVSQNSPSAVQTPASNDLQDPANAQHRSAETATLDLSFRKDSDGTTYYVLTDPQSGQIVREVPPSEVRQVGRGIAEYLKSQAVRTTPKTDSRA